jgi:hypothetical protein
MKTYAHYAESRWIILRTRNISDKFVEKIKTQILCSITFFAENRTLLRMRYLADKSYRENQNTHFMFYKFFFRKLCRLWDNVEKYDAARQATDDNII